MGFSDLSRTRGAFFHRFAFEEIFEKVWIVARRTFFVLINERVPVGADVIFEQLGVLRESQPRLGRRLLETHFDMLRLGRPGAILRSIIIVNTKQKPRPREQKNERAHRAVHAGKEFAHESVPKSHPARRRKKTRCSQSPR